MKKSLVAESGETVRLFLGGFNMAAKAFEHSMSGVNFGTMIFEGSVESQYDTQKQKQELAKDQRQFEIDKLRASQQAEREEFKTKPTAAPKQRRSKGA